MRSLILVAALAGSFALAGCQSSGSTASKKACGADCAKACCATPSKADMIKTHAEKAECATCKTVGKENCATCRAKM